MLVNNADQVAKDLEQYTVELRQKLIGMIAGFAGDVALQAALSTPRASEEYVESHRTLYAQRKLTYGIDESPGYHQGSWKFSDGNFVPSSEINSPAEVEYAARTEAEVAYQVGEDFYIAAVDTPNMPYLANRDDIAGKVTEAGVLASYASNLKLHFDRN